MKKLIIPLLFILLTSSVYATSSLSYISPTPNDNASILDNDFVRINISVNESNLQELKYNWDGTNFTIFNDSLVLMMNFDNVSDLGESNGAVIDISEYNHTITINNTSPTFTNSGKFNGAYQFNGGGMFYTPSYKPEIRTLMFWMKTYDQYANLTPPYDDPQNRYLFSQRFDSTETIGEWDMGWFSQPKLRIYAYYNNGGSAKGHALVTNTDFSTNIWYHVAVTSDGSQVVYYVNGQLDSTHVHNVVLGGSNNDDELFIGGGGANDNLFYFNGTLDEIRVWNRTLSADEVYQHYVSNLNKINSTQWSFYINQSENATNGLAEGAYTYFAAASNNTGAETILATRTINIGSIQALVPEFSDYAIMLILITTIGGFFYIRKRD